MRIERSGGGFAPLEVFPGTPGDDSYTGTADADQATGGDGNDTLNGAGGDDTLSGGSGNDNLTGGPGNDFLDGGPGYDRAIYADGTSGVTIDLNITGAQDTGGSGMDTLVNIEAVNGSKYADTLTGDSHNNELMGAQGDDVLEGGGGNDILNGGGGFDTASFAHAGVGVHVDLSITGAQNTQVGMDTLTAFEALTGSTFNDVLTGDGGNNTLTGGDGIDKLTGGAGDDTLDGGAGDDKLYDGPGSDAVAGGDGNDHFFTSIDDFYSYDSLEGGAGNDTLEVTGFDSFQGYAFDLVQGVVRDNSDASHTTHDTFSSVETFIGDISLNAVLTGDAHGITVYNVNPAAVLDTTGYSTLNASNTINLATGVANLGRRFYGFSHIVAGDTANTITGTSGDDSIITGKGDDTISGGDGNDTIWAYGGTNVIDGGGGTDTLEYLVVGTVDLSLTGAQNTGVSTDTISGIENVTCIVGASTLIGNDGKNILVGGDGASILRGGGGNDGLHGGNGNDLLDGGPGDDSFGGSYGIDTVTYASANAGVTVSLAINTKQNTIGAGTDKIGSDIENLTGSDYADTLTGSNIANTLDGGLGSNTLTGGYGADHFAFTTTLGDQNIDTIADFTAGSDKIDLAHTIFTGLAAGALASGAFDIGAAASDADGRIIYNSVTGALFFDSDGTGSAAQIQFATLSTGLSLSASSFVVT